MKIIVGLGNPDKKYFGTYHNLGFAAADKTAGLLGFPFTTEKFNSLIAEGKIGDEKVIIAKPLTYMNLSGTAVREILSFYKAGEDALAVLYDDVDLPKGNIRIRESGSAGTHNGMRNIIAEIKSEKFIRMRIGFKPTDNTVPLINLVLSRIPDTEKEIFEKATDAVAHAAAEFAAGAKIGDIMQKYNGKA